MWCQRFHPTVALPEEPVEAANIIAEFAMYSFEYGFNSAIKGNSAGTVKSKLSAISFWLKVHGSREEVYTPALTMLLRGLSRMSGGAARKALRFTRPAGNQRIGQIASCVGSRLPRPEFPLAAVRGRLLYQIQVQALYFTDK